VGEEGENLGAGEAEVVTGVECIDGLTVAVSLCQAVYGCLGGGMECNLQFSACAQYGC
jgi:hypothetical protein